MAWDESGVMYVSEAAVPADGGIPSIAALAGQAGDVVGRIVRVGPDVHEVVVDGLNSPVTDVKIRDGMFYVAHRDCVSAIEVINGAAVPGGRHQTPSSCSQGTQDTDLLIALRGSLHREAAFELTARSMLGMGPSQTQVL